MSNLLNITIFLLAMLPPQAEPKMVEVARFDSETKLVERATFAPGGAPVEHIAFAPRSEAFATASGPRVVYWERGQACANFDLSDYVSGLAFDPLGRYLAASGGSLAIFDRQRGACAVQELGKYGPAAWSPDGRYLALKNVAGQTVVLERDSFAPVAWRVTHPAPGELQALLWDANSSGFWLAAGNSVGRFDIAKRELDLATLYQPTRPAGAVYALMRVQERMGILSRRGGIQFASGEEIRTPAVDHIALSPDGTRYMMAAVGGREVIELIGGELRQHAVPFAISAIAFDAHGRLAIATTDGLVHLDALARSKSEPFDARAGARVSEVAFTPDARFVIAAGARVAIYERASGTVRELNRAGVLCAGREGAEFLIATTHAIEAWDAERVALTQTWLIPGRTMGVPGLISLAPDRRSLLVSPTPHLGVDLRLLDLDSGQWRVIGQLVVLLDVAWRGDSRYALGVCFLPSCTSLLPMFSRMRLIEHESHEALPVEALHANASGAFFTKHDAALIWSDPSGTASKPSGLFRRRWPDGPTEHLSAARYYRLCRVGEDLLLGVGRDAIDLCSSEDGRRLQHLAVPAINILNTATAALAASEDGRWIAVGLGPEVRVYEIVR